MSKYPNSGALFHQRTKKNPKAPDYTGDLVIDLASFGVGDGELKIRLAGWKKLSQKGTTFLSLNASKPLVVQEEQPVDESLNDEIPF